MDKSAIDTPDLRPRLPVDAGPAFPIDGQVAHELALSAVAHINRGPHPSEFSTGYATAYAMLATGVSMRDLFALGAMQSYITHLSCGGTEGISKHYDEIAGESYGIADAMLKARQS